ncbi:MAG: ZPR1 zinc finger domain-containing protein [Candidatus Nezhaarchaeota archaeon]|nr:ZPR1 zinc finger domain-containing protein [Candidatus Nezhaarchaeota archaeon]
MQGVAHRESKEHVVCCPLCGEKRLLVIEAYYELPNLNTVYLFSALCHGCGFKHNDIMEVTPHQEPSRFTVRVERAEDLNHLVVRSSHASVKIPEFGVTITPGPYAEGIITTIEGFLHRIKEIAEFLLSSEDDKRKKERCAHVLKKLASAIEGKEAFTFIIEDPSGLSLLIPKSGVPTKVIKEPLRMGR